MTARFEVVNWSLFDGRGQRKYLSPAERANFISLAGDAPPHIAGLCLTLAYTGARISEALALTGSRIDPATGTIILETLKRRRKGMFRAVPVPNELIRLLLSERPSNPAERIWKFSRVTAWKHVKTTMSAAGVPPYVARPRALRHAFGVAAVQQRIALSLVKKWLGHAKIETTAIYAEPVGEEERALARLTWPSALARSTLDEGQVSSQ